MGKDSGSWCCQQRSPWQSANPNCTSIPPDVGAKDGQSMALPTFAGPYVSLAELALPKLVGQNELRQWYCHYSPETCTPAKKSIHELFSGSPHTQTADAGMTNAHKGFFVFDQTGNRTSLIFSSVCPPANAYSLHGRRDFGLEPLVGKKENHVIDNSDGKLEWCSLEETDEWGQEKEKSVMREDTAELDALLYSDDEKEEEEEEEASTGHSPLDICEYYEKKEAVNDRDEVGSYTPTKKRRLNETDEDMAEVLMDTASSGKPQNGMWPEEDDAESSCIKGNGNGWGGGETHSKRSRRERIKETVGVLRSIIPGGKSKGKDAAVVLDDAIRYLRSLKMKANGLGLGSALH
ncbi:transcription factor bHLH143-like [Aristolochia californica]|uniref:transcription factor bHLH143-like n=1 Tax=Aristolochia californica TaxID=171875 RepID=UPI0035D65026